MPVWAWALVGIAAAAVVFVIFRVWRTRELRDRFGSEYERAVEEAGNRRGAESELKGRERRRSSLEIVPLSTEDRDRFSEQWRTLQARFVDRPADALREADVLV